MSNLVWKIPLLELRYILKEILGFSLEDQIFKKELEINKSQISEMERILAQRKKKKTNIKNI